MRVSVHVFVVIYMHICMLFINVSTICLPQFGTTIVASENFFFQISISISEQISLLQLV